MTRRWLVAEPISQEFISKFPEIPRIVLQILVNRGVVRTDMSAVEAQVAIDEFLNPDYGTDIHDPFLFRDMQRTVDRLAKAIHEHEKITVYGDYDADGVSGAVILTSTLKVLGADVGVYIPHRETEGYGVNRMAVGTIADGGSRVMITCDCGISNREEIIHANGRGIDVIITDHHTLPNELPPAYAIIHPLVPGETYPFKGLAGGGVAFKLAQALLRTIPLSEVEPPEGGSTSTYRFDPSSFEKWLLDMVVVSTVADMVPLLGENRTLTTYGLVVLNKTRRIGLKKLIALAGLAKRERKLDTYTIGWGIAPRINAAGRMDHANTAYKLCVTEDQKEAEELALALNATNAERQATVAKLVDDAIAQVGDAPKDRVLMVVGDHWPLGLVGLVAGKLSDRFYRPAIVITDRDGELAGSGRSIVGVNLMAAFQALPKAIFKKFGGHPMACGFTLASNNALTPFTEELRRYAEKNISGDVFVPTLAIDVSAELGDITWALWEKLERLEPFGEKHPRPRYLTHDIIITHCAHVGEAGNHLRCTVERGGVQLPCIGFGLTERVGDLAVGDHVDIVYEIDVNEWNGTRTLQLKLIDLRKLGNTVTP